MELTLHYTYQDKPEKTYQVSGNEAIIGRPKDIPIHLDLSPDLKVSRPHARLYYDLGTWWVEDLGSKYGTFLNGEKISKVTELLPNDSLQFGETSVRIEFSALDTYPGSGKIESHVDTDECRAPQQVLTRNQLAIFEKLSNIIGHSKNRDAKLERLLDTLKDAFPTSDRQTVLLVKGKELRPQVFWPPDEAHASLTLARTAITSKQAILWVHQTISQDKPISSSLEGTLAAMYAPMLSGGKIIGVVHVDSVSLDTAFNDNDLKFLSCIANFMAAALQDLIRVEPEGEKQRLRQQIADLQQHWDLLSQKIVRLRAQHVAETRTEEKFRLEQLIAEATSERDHIEQQLQDLESRLSSPIFEKVEDVADLKDEQNQNIRILFLAANPKDTNRLRLDEEVREIENRLRTAEYRIFDFIQHWAVRSNELSEFFLRHTPHIVHFSGHGSKSGKILLEGEIGKSETVPPEALGQLFRILKDNIRCVVLNACLSANQAEAIVQEIDCVVGMSAEIGDEAAICFAGGFYRALGYGRSVQTAFELGCNEIDLTGLDEGAIPQLLVKPGVNAADITFI